MAQVQGNVVPYANPTAYADALSTKMSPTTFNFSTAYKPGTVAPIPTNPSPTTMTTTPAISSNYSPYSSYTAPSLSTQSTQTTQTLSKPPTSTPTSYSYQSNPFSLTDAQKANVIIPGQANNINDPTLTNPQNTNTGGTTQNQTPTYSGIVGSLVNKSQGPSQAYTDAYNQAQQYNQALTQSRENEAKGLAGINSAPIPLEFQQGRGQVLQSQYAQEQAALGAGFQGASTLMGAANTQQGLEQSGLSSAAGYAQPQLGQYGQGYYNPLSGGMTGGSNLDPQTQATTLAQKVMSGSMTYDQALSSMGYAGSVGTNFLNNAITGAGGNPLRLQAQGAGQQNTLQSIPAMQSANTAAQGIANTIDTFLKQNPTINSSPLAVGNLAQQWIQGKQLTDPAYQQFFNYLSEYANTLAPVLGVGGDPTNMKTQIASAFLNPQASGQSTMQVLQSMGALATQKISNLQSGATGGGVVSGSSGGNIWSF